MLLLMFILIPGARLIVKGRYISPEENLDARSKARACLSIAIKGYKRQKLIRKYTNRSTKCNYSRTVLQSIKVSFVTTQKILVLENTVEFQQSELPSCK